MNNVTYFHRNKKSGYSINKVTQTIITDFKNKHEYYLPYYNASPGALLFNIIFTFIHRDKHLINHVTGDIHYVILALIGCKSVLTIHDTASIDFDNLPHYKKTLIKWFWYKIPLALSSKVVCISYETRKYVEQYTSRRDILVIHNAVDPLFHRIDKNETSLPKRILLIGTNENKNVERTISALAGIECKLIIVGVLSNSQNEILQKSRIDYENVYDLTDEQILEEYAKADIVSNISLFEGFGMTIIEANKVGRPVICSNIPVLKEIAGQSALFVNPTDITDMRTGFEQLINNYDKRRLLVEKGFQNVKRFNAEDIRKQWMELYNSLL